MKNRGHAFTLMELIVVVAIIAVLVAIVLGVATGVTNTGRAALARDTIRVLELSLEDYTSEKAARPAYYLRDPRVDGAGEPLNPDEFFPIADARDMSDNDELMINSCGLAIQQFKEVASAYDNIVGSLDTDAFRPYSPTPLSGGDYDTMRQPLLPTAFDPWGNPIRYVHPMFDGLLTADLDDPGQPVDIETDLGLLPPKVGQEWVIEEIRRNAEATDLPADSDGGLCPGDHPYFYSAGPDGDPSTTDDNVYGASTPTFQRPEG